MTHGKGREFKKLPSLTSANLESIKPAHLELLLLESERAWAYAMELNGKADAEVDSGSKFRHHSTGRFRPSLLPPPPLISAHDLLEATAYTLLLNGRFLLSREDHEDALSQLCVARYVLDLLASHAQTSRDHALAVLWIDQVGPLIRWSAHQMGRAKAYDVDAIVRDVAPKHIGDLVEGWDGVLAKFKEEGDQTTSSTLKGKGGKAGKLDSSKLMWEGEVVPVRNPELVDVLLRVQGAEEKLSSSKQDSKTPSKSKGKGGKKAAVAAYDAVLAALSDAEDVARKLNEAQKSSSSTFPADSSGGQSGTGQARDMHFVHTYIVYRLLSKRIQRDLLLVDAVDPRLHPALIKLLDTILQSLAQMRTLSIVDDSPELSASVEGRVEWTKARRCLTLSLCYGSPPNTKDAKYAEALILLQHAGVHLRSARQGGLDTIESDSAEDPNAGVNEFYPLTKSGVDALDNSVARLGTEYKRAWMDKGVVGAEGEDGKKTKKPTFFNIALNYAVDLDDPVLMGRLRERAGKAPVPTPAPPSQRPGSDARVAPTPKTPAAAKGKTLEDNISRSGTPEPKPAAANSNSGRGSGGLSGLLGGWWGRS
ncbi:hypothetical protein BT96DRAFT_928631 [Gymnopus androsaceus JB14]|uniref:Signal recognition particle subunit SRP68 n=1 Tax=Gymnopus androsaceus JB14 TaxID=1447944 RepID=A0A6A4GK75_9AGAR|nr:hypothetical protein BT96DRAFT_928631 [Gymnopus androsaceus JB14]